MPPSKASGAGLMLAGAVFSYLCPTPFGDAIIFWSIYKKNPRVLGVILSGDPGLFKNSTAFSHPKIKALADKITAFSNGKDIRFPLKLLRLDRCSIFQQKVLAATAAIPRGRVSTYQLLAKQMGKPKTARAIGSALAANPFPLIIPCHRVIRSDGALGGYQGGLKMKQALLNMEAGHEKS